MTTAVKMTSEQARLFDRFSVGNAIAVKTALHCGCEPYQDVFTYRRWQAMRQQVRRGEKAIKLPVIREVLRESEDGEKLVKRFGTAAVFCRCQVDAIGTRAAAPTAPATPAPSAPKAAPVPSAVDTLMKGWQEL